MEIDTNPYRRLSAEITPMEFEKFCLETLKAYAEKESLKGFEIRHNQKVETYDGTYQIDVLAEYTALGCRNTVVVECKKYTRNVERSVVAELYAKVQSIGAQKGILISTSGFQKDAVKFAGVHGIALWQVCEEAIKHITNAMGVSIVQYMLVQLRDYLPKFFMLSWDCSCDYPFEQIYPTDEMRQQAIIQLREEWTSQERLE